MYAVVIVIAHMIKAHLYPLVSCLIAPIVPIHGTYSNVNAMNEYAESGVKVS